MPFKFKPSALTIKIFLSSFILTSLSSHADKVPEKIADFEVITITNQRIKALENNESFAQGKTSEPDLANWLTSVPGANVNSNGPVTGIAQYRGLYGDRIAISLDNHPVIGAGPNSMDTPLSYSTPLIVDSMTVYRGIAPVAAGINTLAGSIKVNMRKADVVDGSRLQTTGDFQTGYRSNNNAQTLSSVINVSKSNVGVMLYGNVQSGDDMESGSGDTISPTEFEKRQFGGDMRYGGFGQDHEAEIGFSYHYTDTQNSGTPALPMDIECIFSHRAGLDGEFSLGLWQAFWTLGFVDADHGMTNFLMRKNDNGKKYRRNNATAITTDFSFSLQRSFALGDIEIGFDGYLAEHNSVITNPNNAMFTVVNFNDVQDDRVGLYLQWQQQFGDTNIQLGTRIKSIKADADEVATSMAMMDMPMSATDMNPAIGTDLDTDMDNMAAGMAGDMSTNMDDMTGSMGNDMPSMGDLARNLRNNFNTNDRSRSDTLVDFALNSETQLSEALTAHVGLGIKTRAPSYQERYLWTPMESTGGLADGNTYIGDLNLKAERAYQVDLGLHYQTQQFSISPHIFYQNIDDYIQGTSLGMTDMSAKMMANMMSGDENPLKFSNVDAKLYGMDINWRYELSEHLQLSGVASYVRGERRDIDDNLYRVAPLNGQLNVTYSAQSWIVNAAIVGAVKQDKVSLTNAEKESAGYGIVNLDIQYFINTDVTIRAGIDNVFDKEYQNHLGGYNRVKGSDIAVMARLPATGLSAWAELTYSF
ncbi:MAG: iron complex outermembrane receptor protein [Alteromonadaceae bacterium]|jgi:iron complex outermembrane receptor protein